MIHIKILDGHHAVQNRQYKDKQTGELKTTYFQKAYIDLGGAFPVEFNVRLQSEPESYPVGNFTLSHESFKVNGYNSLEIGYGLKLIPTKG